MMNLSKHGQQDRCALQEVREYWERMLERMDRPAALKLIPQLDLGHPLGFTALGEKAKGSSTLVPFMLETKRVHPTKVLLVRVRACVLPSPACADRESSAHDQSKAAPVPGQDQAHVIGPWRCFMAPRPRALRD